MRALAQEADHSEHGGGDGLALGTLVGLLVLVSGAYLLAHFVVDRLQKRFLVVAGAEYLLLGVLLGPATQTEWAAAHHLTVLTSDNLTGLMPFIALAAGWVGLMRGTGLRRRYLGASLEHTPRIVATHTAAAVAIVGGASFMFLQTFMPGLSYEDAALAAAVLGCCAAADSTVPIDLLAKRYALEGPTGDLLRAAARAGDVGIIIIFGIVFCRFHPVSEEALFQLTATEWTVVSILLGATLGGLFSFMLGGDESENARFLALVGIISFAAGAAYFLQISPLLVNLTLGIVLIRGRAGPAIRQTLLGTEKPVYLLLMVMAGALWRPTDPSTTAMGIIVFISIRLLGKAVGSWFAGFGSDLRRDLFRGLLVHGEVTVAMAVSFRVVFDGEAVDIAYSIILASVIFHDIVGPRAARSLLVDAGELRRELPGETGEELDEELDETVTERDDDAPSIHPAPETS